MKKARLPQVLFAALIISALILSACTPATATQAPATQPPAATNVPATQPPAATDVPAATATTPPTAEPTEDPMSLIGTEAHPIKVLFVPSVDAQIIVSGGDLMADALNEATGLFFEVSVPTSYAATIEEMCASPTDTMAFIPALGYVLANQLCGVDVAFKAIRRGWGVYWTEFIVRRDSGIETLDDLNGLQWAYPDAGSTSGYLIPLVFMKDAGIVPGEELEAGGHPQTVSAVYDGTADFGTTFFSPFAVPAGTDPWDIGDDPDVPEDVLEDCAPDGDALMCGGYRVLDARANIRVEAPDVIQEVKILTLTTAIPNDTMSFSPDFPAELRAQIEEALVDFAETEAWANSIGSEDFYGWSGVEAALDEEYDIIRLLVEEAGYSLEDL